MNKIYRLSALWMMCLMLLSCFTFTACNNGDEEDTNQYKGGVSLNVFGPCPVARGGELRFLGSGMDQIVAVIIPGCDEISGDDIKVISSQEIRVIVPQTATVGTVTLKSSKGEIVTKTEITYSEPISLDEYSPLSVKAGDVITIKGEYLNLINEVIFADGVIVDQFVSHSRNEIKVVVPIEAQTGKIIISDGAEIPNWIYSEEELSVKLPTITTIAPNPLKAGQKFTITGADFNLVAKVILPGGHEVEVENASTKIEVDTPADIKEGEVILVAKSGVEVKSVKLNLTKPAITSISSATVKNNAEFTITGTNLDLVSTVAFEGVEVSEFVSQSATQIVLVIPATAANGAFTLKTLSATETAGSALTFVKPAVTALSAASIKSKQDLTLTGTNLDLVTTVTFGSVSGTIVSATSASLVVTVPVGAESGPITLKTANGTGVVTTQNLTIAVTLPVITSIKSEGPEKKFTIEGTELDLIKTIYLADKSGNYTVRVTDYGLKTATKVEFYHVKEAATGIITPLMVTWDGDEGLMPEVYCGGTDLIKDASYIFYDFDGKGSWWGSYGSVEFNPDLALNGNYFRINQDLPGGWVDFFWRNGKNDLKTDGVNVNTWAVKMDVLVMDNDTQEFKFRMNGSDGDFWAIIPSMKKLPGWYTVTIPLTDFKDNGGYGPNVIPTVENVTSEFGLATNGAAGHVNMCIDNIRFDLK